MARYNRQKGPPVDTATTNVNTPIPGLTLTRWFDNGEALVLYNSGVLAGAAIPTNVVTQLFLDGTNVLSMQDNRVPTANIQHTHHAHDFLPLTEGFHTFEVQIAHNGANALTIMANRSALAVVQLPVWDQAANVAPI